MAPSVVADMEGMEISSFQFATDPGQFSKMLLQVFDSGLLAPSSVPDVEGQVLQRLH